MALGAHDCESGRNMREFLANERTWLAYVRTAITTAAIGMSLIFIYYKYWHMVILGSLFIFVGVITTILGFIRYRQRKVILRKKYQVKVRVGSW